MKYNVVYADPAWSYGSKLPFEAHNKNGLYHTMPDHRILNLPVRHICKDDCALFLWTTDHHLPLALRVIQRWGFEYKNVAYVWAKYSKNGKLLTLPSAGWTRKSTEICLLGVKGRIYQYTDSATERQFVQAIRREHSRKPDEIRNSIDRLIPNVPRVELFARQCHAGWHTWGNEVTCDVTL